MGRRPYRTDRVGAGRGEAEHEFRADSDSVDYRAFRQVEENVHGGQRVDQYRGVGEKGKAAGPPGSAGPAEGGPGLLLPAHVTSGRCGQDSRRHGCGQAVAEMDG